MAESSRVIDQLKVLELTTQNGQPYWMARDIMPVLDYREWRDFKEVIDRAKSSCENAGNFVANHFVPMPEMVEIESGAKRERENLALSKCACYLIAMNGDTSKPEIATAQAYFVKQYRQEAQERLSEEERRLLRRDRVKDANRKLGGAAKGAGVRAACLAYSKTLDTRGRTAVWEFAQSRVRRGSERKRIFLIALDVPNSLRTNSVLHKPKRSSGWRT